MGYMGYIYMGYRVVVKQGRRKGVGLERGGGGTFYITPLIWVNYNPEEGVSSHGTM